jgi:hypothetical protein
MTMEDPFPPVGNGEHQVTNIGNPTGWYAYQLLRTLLTKTYTVYLYAEVIFSRYKHFEVFPVSKYQVININNPTGR